MHHKKFLFWVIVVLCLSSSCMKEPVKESITPAIPTDNTQHEGVLSPSGRDTFLTVSPRVAELYKRHQFDLSKSFKNLEDRSGLDAIERLLNREEITADTEFFISLNSYLGLLYSGRGEYDRALKCWKTAEQAAQTDKAKYRTSLTFVLVGAANINVYLKNYSEAIRLWKILAEEHQGMGYGTEKNGISANSILRIARVSKLVPEEKEKINNYLIEVSKKYRNNEVGHAAVASLYDMSKEAGDEQKANQYLIELSSYPVTPEYRAFSEPILNKWKQVEARKEQ